MPSIKIAKKRIYLDQVPGECPLCHRVIEPKGVHASFAAIAPGADSVVEVVYRCTGRQCGRLFIARHVFTSTYRNNEPDYRFFEVVPRSPLAPSLPEEVGNVSPRFARIRAQACAAEAYDLSDIAGVGYRKALEFLVKDYCIALHPEEVDDIHKTPLSRCIKDYVDDSNLKTCAQRATWLGNDETHYMRIWKDRDIEDLKTLIKLTVNWVHNSILTKSYEAEMRPPGNPE